MKDVTREDDVKSKARARVAAQAVLATLAIGLRRELLADLLAELDVQQEQEAKQTPKHTAPTTRTAKARAKPHQEPVFAAVSGDSPGERLHAALTARPRGSIKELALLVYGSDSAVDLGRLRSLIQSHAKLKKVKNVGRGQYVLA